jgi:tRNA(Met) C34 N-acetyltransferase TmcA
MLLQTKVTGERNLICVEPCVEDAKTLVDRLQSQLYRKPNQRLRDAFTALANGDAAVGLLAFYLWRRRSRRWK